jgi:hypothetical protein
MTQAYAGEPWFSEVFAEFKQNGTERGGSNVLTNTKEPPLRDMEFIASR